MAAALWESSRIPVGQTPREIVWSFGKTTVYRYTPKVPVEQRYPVPLLIVYAIVNRPFILDLRPGYSFVEHMLDEGFDVYLIDWGEPGPEDSGITLDDYAVEFLPRVVRRVLRDASATEVSVLGYCFGSLISLLYGAIYPESPMRNLITLTPPADMSFTDGSKFSTWLDERWFHLDTFVEGIGNLPAEIIKPGAKMLKAVANYWTAYVNLWDRLENEDSKQNWQAMHRWVHDGVNVPAEAFRQWVRDYLWANELANGTHMVRGRRVDLGDIEVPILNLLAEYDHIVPAGQSLPVCDLVGSEDATTEVLRAGHIGIMAGRSASDVAWPFIARWLTERSGTPPIALEDE